MARNSRRIGAAGIVAEAKTAKRVNAILTPNSGALAGAKGDMKVGDFLMEAKSTTNDSMGIKLDWLAKINSEALRSRKHPALSVVYADEKGDPRQNGAWVMIPEWLFERLLGEDE
jgi:UDP-N-acetyl-D-mannosaminuronic acid transferase (WecB/TagA/CpsF family)